MNINVYFLLLLFYDLLLLYYYYIVIRKQTKVSELFRTLPKFNKANLEIKERQFQQYLYSINLLLNIICNCFTNADFDSGPGVGKGSAVNGSRAL